MSKKNNNLVFIGGNGYVYGIYTNDGSVAWETELKPGWWKTGNSFVSLLEDDKYLYAFSYGILYRLSKENGNILMQGNEIKKLKNQAGVFSSDPDASTGGAVFISSYGGSNDGGSHTGDGGGGGGGGH